MFVWGELKLGVPNSVWFCIGDLPMYIFLIPTHPYLLLLLEVWDYKPTYRKSWAGNLLVWSDLTLDPLFKVKQG